MRLEWRLSSHSPLNDLFFRTVSSEQQFLSHMGRVVEPAQGGAPSVGALPQQALSPCWVTCSGPGGGAQPDSLHSHGSPEQLSRLSPRACPSTGTPPVALILPVLASGDGPSFSPLYNPHPTCSVSTLREQSAAHQPCKAPTFVEDLLFHISFRRVLNLNIYM